MVTSIWDENEEKEFYIYTGEEMIILGKRKVSEHGG